MNTSTDTTDIISVIIKETKRIQIIFTTRNGTEFSDKQSALLHELREMREVASNKCIDPMNGFCNLAKFISMFPEAVPMLNELATTFTD